MDQRIYRPAFRRRKAYATAFRVMGSYLWLRFVSRFRGKRWHQKQIGELNHRNADRIKKTILQLQGLFIKFGQLISILSNILPAEFREPLESLQDKVPPRDYSEVRQTIQAQLGKTPEELFDHFEETPIAAASIGQVHKARLGTEEVIVKIQHANIEQTAQADLLIIRILLRLVARFYQIRGFEHLYEQVRQMIEEELDYKREATAMKIISESFEVAPDFQLVIPEVFPAFTTPKILVARFHAGVSIGNVSQLDAWNIDREDLMDRLIRAYCKMILLDGYYHADPHPGNILVNEQGQLVLLDFGATAWLSNKMKGAIPKLIQAIIQDDDAQMLQALQEMGCISKTKESYRTAEKFLGTLKEFINNELEIDNLNVKVHAGAGSILRMVNQLDLREMTQAFEIPKDWVLLNRTITLLGGLSNQVAPGLNPVQVVRPFIKKHLIFTKDGISKIVWDTLKTQATAAIALPGDTHRFLKMANKGDLEIMIRGVSPGFKLVYLLGQQFLFAGLTIYGFSLRGHLGPSLNLAILIGTGLSAILFLRALWRGRKLFRHSD
ncbi:MAG: AarF/ABC1/UbiB kinase family protein [Saprospiraceae bacterium]|nr:AarF/ABC1/UbiB kinase family protein [Saprospiraceae bacterium]